MNLATYLKKTQLNKAAFAREIGISSALLYQFEKGIRPVPPRHCPAIEAASDGKVTRKDLRPTDWQLIWPTLAEPK
jgi:DNA-binding transcriptional regulator YdaS (Cro superfamily)